MVEVDLQIFISKDGEMLLNPERVALLRLVQRNGSLHSASQHLGISYNKAWKMLYAMNSATNNTVVEKTRGGQGGGGTSLTSFGKLILAEYDSIEKEINNFKQKINTEIQM